jgi:hypothetical protein
LGLFQQKLSKLKVEGKLEKYTPPNYGTNIKVIPYEQWNVKWGRQKKRTEEVFVIIITELFS